jgi:hypothetical protein
MLVPDVYKETVIDALVDMGADIHRGNGELAFQGMFQGRVIFAYNSGAFTEIKCSHEETYRRLMQIVQMIVAHGGLDE